MTNVSPYTFGLNIVDTSTTDETQRATVFLVSSVETEWMGPFRLWMLKNMNNIAKSLASDVIVHAFLEKAEGDKLSNAIGQTAIQIQNITKKQTTTIMAPDIRYAAATGGTLAEIDPTVVARSYSVGQNANVLVMALMVTQAEGDANEIAKSYEDDTEEIIEAIGNYSVRELHSGKYNAQIAKTISDIIGKRTLFFIADSVSCCMSGPPQI